MLAQSTKQELADNPKDPGGVLEQVRNATRSREQAAEALQEQTALLQNELLLAAEFQRAVLPDSITVPYLDVSIIYRPYAEVSGDVYDFLQNREGEQAIFLGDATGHGIAAALMTMMIHIGLEGLRRNLPVDQSMSKLNRLIAARETGKSVSAVFFRITPAGRLSVAHAGHPSLVVIPADGGPLLQFEKGGCALGVFADEPIPYEEETLQLEKGDRVFAYTDGILEWGNEDREIFGLDRLLACLMASREQDIDLVNRLLVEELEAFAAGQHCKDDLSALLFEFSGRQA